MGRLTDKYTLITGGTSAIYCYARQAIFTTGERHMLSSGKPVAKR